MKKNNPMKFKTANEKSHSAKKKIRTQVLKLEKILLNKYNKIDKNIWNKNINKESKLNGSIPYIFSYDTYIKYKDFI